MLSASDLFQTSRGTFIARLNGQTFTGTREQCESWFRANGKEPPTPQPFLSLTWKEICQRVIEQERRDSLHEPETTEIPGTKPPTQ